MAVVVELITSKVAQDFIILWLHPPPVHALASINTYTLSCRDLFDDTVKFSPKGSLSCGGAALGRRIRYDEVGCSAVAVDLEPHRH